MSNTYYQQLIRQGSGIVTGFSPQTIKSVMTKVCDYFGMLEETNPLMVLDYKDKNDVSQQILFVTKSGVTQLIASHGISVWVYKTTFDEKLNAFISYARGYRYNTATPKTIAGNIGVEVIDRSGKDYGFDTQSAMQRSATKSIKRVVLQLVGLGFLDEETAMDMQDNQQFVEIKTEQK
jgi:hypothetical protein